MIVAQDVSDPLNIGALFRLADAQGVASLYLCGQSPRPPHKRISKTARSTDQFVPFEYHTSTLAAIEKLRAKNYRIIGLEITDASEPIDRFTADADHPLALVIGAESQGLHPDTLAVLDAAVHIPMYGRNTSMNVIQACGIAIYALTRKLL